MLIWIELNQKDILRKGENGDEKFVKKAVIDEIELIWQSIKNNQKFVEKQR